MAKRRSVLRGLVASMVPLAGCSSFGNGDEEKEHVDVDVMNVSGEPQVVTVEIMDNGEVIFNWEYDLSKTQGDLSQSFTGEPGTVLVDVEDGASESFEFRPPIYCIHDQNQDPKVILTIYEADDVGMTYGCAR